MIDILQKFILIIIGILTPKSTYHNDDINHKIMNEIDVSNFGIKLKTHKGYSNVNKLFKTRDYEIYIIKTQNGKILKCADKHLIFDAHMHTIFVRDLKIGDTIITDFGADNIVNIKRTGIRCEMYDIEIDNEDHAYYTSGILSHNTTTTAIFFSHFTIFNTDKNTAIVAQRNNVASEIFSKVKSIITFLPFFLKPGCLQFTNNGYKFDNGCSCVFRPAAIDCLQGASLDLMFADEVAYIRNKQAREWWNNVYPTLSASTQSRVILCSTPNGRNLFWELWTNSIEGKNLFAHFRIDWWEIPGRDEKWKQQEIANLGSIAAFEQQYNLSFDTSIFSVLSAENFHYLNKISTKFKPGLFKLGTDYDEMFRWSIKWKYSFKKDWFLISVDIGEGLGGDYSTIKIRKLFKNADGTIVMPTIGVFECNTIIIEDFAKVLLTAMRKFNQEHCRLVIERNSFGDLLIKNMESLAERIPEMEIEVETIAKFRRSVDNPKLEKGIRLNRGNKKIGVANWNKLVNDKIFIETDDRSIDQYREFGEDPKNGTYRASVGHDDLVMPDVNAAFYIKSNNTGWNEFMEEFNSSVTDTDTFNTHAMEKLNLAALSAIKIDTTLDGNEYEFLDLEPEDVDAGNEYSDIDKYIKPKRTRKNPNGLTDKELNEYDMLDSLVEKEKREKRMEREDSLSREDRIKKIANELIL